MKPEEKVELILWDWLKVKSKYIKEIYFNRVNKLNALTFQTKGINKKPDFIIKYLNKFIAIEIKDQEKSKNVLDAGKILDVYYYNYIKNKTKYLIDNQEIEIFGFVVATGNSKKGFLFKDEELKLAKDSSNKSKRYVASIGLIPKIEGDKSHVFVRDLWARHNRIDESNKKPLLGIVISKGIYPYIFCKKFDYNKKKWGQRFFEL